MSDYKFEAFEQLAQTLIHRLSARRMEAQYVASAEEAKKEILKQIPAGSGITWGGSQTLLDAGILDAVKSAGTYDIIDRETAKTPEEKRQMLGKQMVSDYFLMSTNAITLDGQLVNIDGRGNRTAFLICGPEHVFVVCGRNKVTPDVESAIKRVRNIATPANTRRLHLDTPCAKVGCCMDCLDHSICNQIVITRACSGPAGRVKVFLVNEDLGY